MTKFIFPNRGKANPRCTTTRECALAYNLAPLVRSSDTHCLSPTVDLSGRLRAIHADGFPAPRLPDGIEVTMDFAGNGASNARETAP